MGERLRCSECGKLAACNCGVPYVTKAEYVKAHLEPDDDRSNVAIGKQLGVSHETVRAVRKQLQPANNLQVEKRKGRKGLDGKMRRLPRKNGARKINGTGFSLRVANRLRGKARNAYMSKWATDNWNKKLEEHSDLKWEHEVQDELQRIVNLEKRWTEQYGDWRQFSMTPCTYNLLSQAAEVLNGLLSELKFSKTNSNGKNERSEHVSRQ